MPAGPYPHPQWPRFARDDVLLLRRVLRALPHLGPLREAHALLGVEARLRAEAAELCSAEVAAALLAAPVCALSFEYEHGARPLPLLCQLPPSLGASLVDRVLGGDGQAAHPIGTKLDDLSAGVLGYLAARLCAAEGANLHLCGVLTETSKALALLGHERVLVWPLTLEVGGRRQGLLRVLIPEATAQALGTREALPKRLATPLLPLPLTLCAHAAQLVLSRAELAALGPGDVIIPEHCRLVRERDGWHGEVELHVQPNLHASLRCIAHGRELQIENQHSPRSVVMTEAKRIETQALEPGIDARALAGDTPVALCLTLANFTLTLEELSALKPGEILNTGHAIGEHAVLSAAGHAIAHGELCEINGEVGFRVLALLNR